MSQLVCSTVHPVAVIAKVCNVLCLCACVIIYYYAYRAFGNFYYKLSLIHIVCFCFFNFCAGPCAVKLIAVTVPSVYIRLAPAEVICEQECACWFGICCRLYCCSFLGGSNCRLLCFRLSAYESYLVVVAFFFVNCVPLCAVRDICLDIYSLVAVSVEDNSFNVCGNYSSVNLLTEVVDLSLFHSCAGPLRAVRPVVYMYVAPSESVCKLNCDCLTGLCCCVGLGSCGCNFLCGQGLILVSCVNYAVEPILAALSVGTEVDVIYAYCLDLAVLTEVVIHTFGIPGFCNRAIL